MTWHEYFFNMCDVVASRSKDTSTKVGAIIASKNNTIIATGYNDFPKGVLNLEERRQRPNKYNYTIHAEMNCITFSNYAETSAEKTKIYVNSLPTCHVCSGLIINAGIKEVNILNKEVPYAWKDSCRVGIEMYLEAGVRINVHDLTNKGYYILDNILLFEEQFPFKFDNSWGNFNSYAEHDLKLM